MARWRRVGRQFRRSTRSAEATWNHPFLKEESTMKWRNAILILLVSALAGTAGCGGDPMQQMMSNPESRAKMMDAIAGDNATAGEVMDKMMGSEGTRGVVLEKLMGNGEMMQGIMTKIAQDRTMVDGVLNLAVQDSTMRDHVTTLLKGMLMAKGGR
jgi:hypothetical protein